MTFFSLQNEWDHFEQILLEHYEVGHSFEEAREDVIRSEFTKDLDNLAMFEKLEEAKAELWDKDNERTSTT